MSCHPNNRFCPALTVEDPPQTVYRDIFQPQLVRVVRNIEIVNRIHCVPVRCEVFRYSVRDEHVGAAHDENRDHEHEHGFHDDHDRHNHHNNHHNHHNNNCGCNRSTISRTKKSSKSRSKKVK